MLKVSCRYNFWSSVKRVFGFGTFKAHPFFSLLVLILVVWAECFVNETSNFPSSNFCAYNVFDLSDRLSFSSLISQFPVIICLSKDNEFLNFLAHPSSGQVKIFLVILLFFVCTCKSVIESSSFSSAMSSSSLSSSEAGKKLCFSYSLLKYMSYIYV